MELATFASGYKRLYVTDEEELAACLGENARMRGGGIGTIDPNNPRLHWWPSSVDFAAEAARHPPAYPVKTFRAFIEVVRSKKNLTRVYWFGHGADGELQFGNGQRLTASEVLSAGSADVSGSFSTGGEVVFVACNAGQKPEFLQRLANAMRVKVRGFPSGVEWELRFVGVPPIRSISRRGLADPRVTSQGRVFSPQP
jgi:hypothetical protein